MAAQELRLALLRAAQSGDRDAEEAFVSENLGLVQAVVARFAGQRDREELFQIGCVGLLQAVRRFDFTYNVAFSTYAVPLILGEIRQFLRRDGAVHVSRSLREQALQVSKAAAGLEQELLRTPTVGELAEATGLKTDAVVAALGCTAVASLSELEGTVAAETDDPVERLDLARAMEQLSPRERQVLALRFMQDRTQTETAAALGISQTQVSRVERGAVKRLQKNLIGEEK